MQVFLSRIIAAWVAGLASWLLAKYGVTIDANNQTEIVGHIVGIIIPLGTTIYAVVHRLLSKFFNPGDAASKHLAERETAETHQLKAASSFRGVGF